MSIADIIQSIGVLTTIIFSIIALIQSMKSKRDSNNAEKIAEEANRLSQKALDDTRKDYMPLIKFINCLKVTKKNMDILRNEITFDFDELMFNYYDSNEITCISVEIENIGKGIITGIKIEDFFIQEGNKVLIDTRNQGDLETLCYIEKCQCEEKFILNTSERTIINFVITNSVMERNNSDFEWAEDRIESFFKEYDNIMISMSLEIQSLNDSKYKQEHLWGTYLDEKVVCNSFEKAKHKTNV